MKSFKVKDGMVKVDGVIYGQSPKDDVKILGEVGTIHSINIGGKQFFPIGGSFDNGKPKPTVVEEVVAKKPTKLTKTELVETSGKALDENGKPIKKARKPKAGQ